VVDPGFVVDRELSVGVISEIGATSHLVRP
jgi:hypothetical protein